MPPNFFDGLNIIACPSCSRVENERFIELAEEVKEMTTYAAEHDITIAVMGCRVNGPGETDDADLGLWCGPKTVNLKRGPETVDSSDNLRVEYLSPSGTWVTIDTWAGNGSTDASFSRRSGATSDEDALYTGSQLRLRSTGSGATYDDFFIDDFAWGCGS